MPVIVMQCIRGVMMNDRFKFRCWNKKTNEMFLVYSFDKNFIQATNDFVVPSIRRFNIDDCILMQCTGLKDRNGKLIFEGDIVKFNFDTDEIKAVVSWDGEELIGFYLNTTDYFKDKYLTDYDFYKNDYEVIGNIYENKELLNE